MLNRIDVYKRMIANAFPQGENSEDVPMEEVAKKISGSIRPLLGLILADEQLLASVAARSYAHYNGFDKIILDTSEELYSQIYSQLRLHIWWPGGSNGVPENIHNHRWDFGTTLLTGSYRAQVYQPSDEGTAFSAYRYSPPDGQEHYSMEPQGLQKLVCVSDDTYIQGEYYPFDHRQLHRVTIPNPDVLTATLMLQGPRVEDPVWVYSERPISNVEEIDSSHFTPSVLAEKLEQFLNALEGKKI